MNDWKLKQHSLVLSTPPYEDYPIDKGVLRKEIVSSRVLFARWTSEWDCGHPTEWWYCLRDTPIVLEDFKSKIRNEINRGLRTTFYCRGSNEEIITKQDEMFSLAQESFAEYPRKYRPRISKDGFRKSVHQNIDLGGVDYWFCYDKETGKLVGYSRCRVIDNVCNLYEVKVLPQYQKNRVNAGLIFTMCRYYLNDRKLKYICDGQRNIKHETNYQAFLVKTLGFRYAYCRLNVLYHPIVGIVVKLLYPFRFVLKHISALSSHIYNVYSILKQEEIVRSFIET
jgi:hypothetical protein